ncbi:protein RRNAD1 isoform X2 [Biomphalaria glabrata]|nr:protein RRNAD1 isoform X2 [Biomphalaria glabrata]
MEKPVLNFRCTNFPNQLVEVYWQENQTMTLQNFSDLTNLFQRIPIDAIKFHDAESNTEDNDCEYGWVVWLLTALVIICLPLNILKLCKCYKSPRLCKEENPTIYSFETDNHSHMPLERNLFRGLAYRTEPVQLEMSETRCLTGLKCQCLKSMKLNITSDAKCAERFEVIIAQLAPTHFFKSVSMMLQQEVMTQGVVQAVVRHLFQKFV